MCPVKLRFARGAMAKKPAVAKKISIVILQVIRKGNRTAKYSTFATAAPKLWKAQKGVLVLQSQPRWEPSLTDIQVLCTKKKKKLGQQAGFDQAQKYIDAWYHEFVGSH